MKTFPCPCGNPLFFDNSQCVSCGRIIGHCPVCNRTTAPSESEGSLRCGHDDCGAELVTCRHYDGAAVCNWFVERTSDTPDNPLCRSCALTRLIPDLSIEGNRDRWHRLESAKRRVLHQFDSLGIPYGPDTDPPLAFEFKADPDFGGDRTGWRSVGGRVVKTGHADGLITINLAEADAAQREAIRVQFDEDHRTLVGHFRHELGHYVWQMLVGGRRELEFAHVFGDFRNPTYAAALERHHREGPPPDWRTGYVSAYATMHPWEDFAETFAKYLEIAQVLETADHFGLSEPRTTGDEVIPLVVGYESVGLRVNELNRDLGLVDLAPRPIVDAVVPKLEFVHDLVRSARRVGSAA